MEAAVIFTNPENPLPRSALSQPGWEQSPLSGLAQPAASLTLAAAFIYCPETEEVEQSTALLAQAQDFRRNKVFSYLAYQQLNSLVQ